MIPIKLRNRVEARKYVARCLSAILENDLRSGAEYLSHLRFDGGDEDANLADEVSEQRALKAAWDLVAYLDKRGGKK